MIRHLLALAALALAAGTAGAAHVPFAASDAATVSYATDRIELQLRPAAARAARATRAAEAARRGIAPLSAAHTAAPDVAIARIGIAALDRAAQQAGVASFEPEFRGERPPPERSGETDFTSFYIARLRPGVSAERAAALFATLTDVASAERIAMLPVATTPNDSLFSASWWFFDSQSRLDLHAPEAWDFTTGDTAIVVGVIDTGVLPYHPDLGGDVAGAPGQIFTNAAEANGIAGFDDDGNGFVDDAHGWDFVTVPPDGVRAGEDYSDQDPDPNDFAGHGTAVAGVIGAIANNSIGVTGTAWKLRIMPLRIGWSADGSPLGFVDMSFVAQAIRYGTRNGALVLNCSFATLDQSGLFAAARAASRAGVTIVAAAGNGGQPHHLAGRADVVAVAATRRDDVVAGFSNLGPYVDLAAPGAGILTTFVEHGGADSLTLRQPSYVRIDGTSFSSPMVAGAAVLVQAQRRSRGETLLSSIGMALRLSETADDIAQFNPGIEGYGAGRLNLLRALTDRPTSTVAFTGATTIGPAVVLPPDGTLQRIAYLTSDLHLLVMAGQSADTLSLVNLPAFPLRQLAGGFATHPVAIPAGATRALHEGSFSIFTSTNTGRMLGFNDLANALPGWPVVAGGPFTRPLGGPALGDLDGDGTLEVVCGLEDGSVLAWHPDGTIVQGFPVSTNPSGVSAPVALADLDGDGAVEILAACADGEVHLIGGDGNEHPGWPVYVAANPVAPVVTRYSAATGPVIVLAAGDGVLAVNPAGLERFRATLNGNVIQDPALGDLDGDRIDEIVLALDTPALAVLDSTGTDLSDTPIVLTGVPQSPPVIGSLSSFGRDILVMEGTQLAAFGPDGTRRPFQKPGGAGFAPTLVDIDADHATEVLAGTGTDSMLYVYDAGDSTALPIVRGWATPRGNFARTGSRDIGPPSAVRDLDVESSTDSTIRIVWSAPGNEGAGAQAVTVEIRIARDTLTDATFDDAEGTTLVEVVAAGDPRAYVFTGLERGVRYVFAIKTTDAAGNRSRLSNLAAGFTSTRGPLDGHVGPGIAPLLRPSSLPVQLHFRGSGVGAAQLIQLFDVTGRRVRTLGAGTAGEGVVQWNGRDEKGTLVPAGIYFARLISGSVRVQTRVVLLP